MIPNALFAVSSCNVYYRHERSGVANYSTTSTYIDLCNASQTASTALVQTSNRLCQIMCPTRRLAVMSQSVSMP